MFFRILLFFVLAYLIVRLLRSLLSSRGAGSQRHVDKGEDMVLDPQCQSYVPKEDAILRDGHYFCSEKCAQLYLSR